jgi:hypothetical protein
MHSSVVTSECCRTGEYRMCVAAGAGSCIALACYIRRPVSTGHLLNRPHICPVHTAAAGCVVRCSSMPRCITCGCGPQQQRSRMPPGSSRRRLCITGNAGGCCVRWGALCGKHRAPPHILQCLQCQG